MTNKLHISERGSGTPLVFIHGWGVNSAVWQPILSAFEDKYRVITVDLPGFATNQEIVPEPYSIAALAKLIVATIDEPAIYVGWSLGGLVATHIALNATKDVLGLITVASSPCFVATDNWPGIQPEILHGFHQQLCQDTEKTIKGFLKIQAMGSPNIRQDIKLVTTLVMQHSLPEKQILDSSLSLLESSDYRDMLSEIKLPFFRLYGRLDGLVPKKAISQVTELTKQSDHHVFQQASHAPFISHPEEFSHTVLAWLGSVEL